MSKRILVAILTFIFLPLNFITMSSSFAKEKALEIVYSKEENNE